MTKSSHIGADFSYEEQGTVTELPLYRRGSVDSAQRSGPSTLTPTPPRLRRVALRSFVCGAPAVGASQSGHEFMGGRLGHFGRRHKSSAGLSFVQVRRRGALVGHPVPSTVTRISFAQLFPLWEVVVAAIGTLLPMSLFPCSRFAAGRRKLSRRSLVRAPRRLPKRATAIYHCGTGRRSKNHQQ